MIIESLILGFSIIIGLGEIAGSIRSLRNTTINFYNREAK